MCVSVSVLWGQHIKRGTLTRVYRKYHLKKKTQKNKKKKLLLMGQNIRNTSQHDDIL